MSHCIHKCLIKRNVWSVFIAFWAKQRTVYDIKIHNIVLKCTAFPTCHKARAIPRNCGNSKFCYRLNQKGVFLFFGKKIKRIKYKTQKLLCVFVVWLKNQTEFTKILWNRKGFNIGICSEKKFYRGGFCYSICIAFLWKAEVWIRKK